MQRKFELLNTESGYRGFFKLNRYTLKHTSFHGGWCPEMVRERLEGLAAVSVLLYDPVQDAVVLVEQFRIGMAGEQEPPWSLETVSGFCDKAHEKPEDVARREVLEETGCQAADLIPIGSFFVSPGMSVEKIHLFCARVDSTLAQGVHGLAEEGEEMQVVVMPREQARDQLFAQLNSTSIIMALQWLELNRASLLQQWQ